jgi:hypothetical protein
MGIWTHLSVLPWQIGCRAKAKENYKRFWFACKKWQLSYNSEGSYIKIIFIASKIISVKAHLMIFLFSKLKTATYKCDLSLLFVVIFGFFCIGLGARPYITPSEARYIEIPRQILATGDWITPHLNGVQYFEKPPLFYWLQAIFLSIDNSEFGGRIATSLVVTFTCLTTYSIGRLLYNRQAGLLAASALATSILGYGLSRVAMLDAPVTLFLTCAIASFLAAQKTGNPRFYYFMYVASALAVLTKGLIGIVIPAIVIGGWIVVSNNWKILKSARLFTGTLLFLTITAPWHILMAMKHPEFLDFYFIHEHFERFLTDEHKRTAPWWFFIAITAVGALPYWLLLIRCSLFEKWTLKTNTQQLTTNNFFYLWIILPLLFFSASHSKLVPYIFPIFPPLFLLIGKGLADIWQLKKKLIIGTMAIMAVVDISANYIAPQFDKRTIKPLAEFLKPQLKNDDLIIAYNSYWQDLPVYLQKNITVAGWTGELGFGVEHTPDAKNWMISNDEFWNKCTNAQTNVFVFMRIEDVAQITSHLNCELKELARYGKTVLLRK